MIALHQIEIACKPRYNQPPAAVNIVVITMVTVTTIVTIA
jgi:hypothetical protein